MIYVDVSAAVHSRAGLGRYAESLASSLIEREPERFALFYNRGPGGRVPSNLQNATHRTIRLGYKPWRSLVYLANLGRLSFRRLVPGAALFHSTEHLLMPLDHVPCVLTVHDLIFKLYPNFHKRMNYWYLNLAMPLYCRRATAIIAISEATKRDIVGFYKIDPAKIHVVYEAAAEHFKPASPGEIDRVKRSYRLPDQFLLHLSTVEPRKNLDRLVDALMILRREFPELSLILVGSKGWLCDDFFKRVDRENMADFVRHLGWVPDEDLPAVIAAASLAVQPSLYEGFGLPILEHMACGQVVAASDSSSHPEVGGEAAAYFNPIDTEAMASVMRRLLSNPEEYRLRIQLGMAQSEKFSWHKTANETIELYDQLLGTMGGSESR